VITILNKQPALRQIIDLVPRWVRGSGTKRFKTDKAAVIIGLTTS
jgi:hypothetical protein